jgi:aconitate hydratase
LGVKAVITESFERIHRSNLLGMGVLPLVFKDGQTRESLGLKGDEEFDISGIANIEPGCDLDLTIHYPDGSEKLTKLKCRIDTLDELEYYRHGGILHYVLRSMAKSQQENAA